MAIAVTNDYQADATHWMHKYGVRWEDIRFNTTAMYYYGPTLRTDRSHGMVEFDTWTGTITIRTHPVDNEYTYFACMHELGHVANEDWKRLPMGGTSIFLPPSARYDLLRCEAEAWGWAFENAIENPSADVLERSQHAFGTYIRDFGREYVPPKHELHPYLQEV